MREAHRGNYQPGQEFTIDETMVASKAQVLLKHFMKDKPVCWDFKLFVLAESSNGQTWDFCVYQGESDGGRG